MNIWLSATLALLLGFIPCGLVCSRGTPLNRRIDYVAGVTGEA